jgi:adenylate kinase
MNLVFLGPPGSGKGTQAVRVAKALKLAHISTGDLLREAVKNQTELGKKVENIMKEGRLVPDEMVISLIGQKLSSIEGGKGFILDGFPRNLPQAESLQFMFDHQKKKLDKAVLLNVNDNEVVKRLSGRWYCPKCNTGYNYPRNMPKHEGVCDRDGEKLMRRQDDEEAVVRNRLKVYKQETMPIESFYRKRSILLEINGEQGPDSVFQDILSAIKK